MSSDGNAMFRRAIEMHAEGDLDGAERQCQRILAANPDDHRALQMLGSIVGQRGEHQRAVELCTQAADVAPADGATHHRLGMALRSAGDSERAAECFERAHSLAPWLLPAVYNLGIALEDVGRLAEAARAYRRALQLAPHLVAAHYNLGGVLLATGDLEGAERSYGEALRLQPDHPKALNNLGNVLRAKRKKSALREAVQLYRRACELDAGFAGAWRNLGLVLAALGEHGQARASFCRCLDIEPTDGTARHMLAALDGDTTSRTPDGYVASLFDDYAQHFEEHLTGELDYAVPKLLEAMVRKHCGRIARALDLGCGTGLFGERLRSVVERLVGIDLSAKMIDQARAKDVYDELAVDGIESYLESAEQPFDLVAAADVFVYCGDLGRVFELVSRRLGRGGWFVFSTEALERGDEHGSGFELRATGRYAHSRRYLEQLAQRHGLAQRAHQRRALRRDRSGPIEGHLFLLHKPA